jgi:hypothetical protein
VFAALGMVLSMVVVFDRLSDVADSTEPRSPAAFATASAAPLQAARHDDESALPNRVSGSHTAERDGPTGRESQVPPAKPPWHLAFGDAGTSPRGRALHGAVRQ